MLIKSVSNWKMELGRKRCWGKAWLGRVGSGHRVFWKCQIWYRTVFGWKIIFGKTNWKTCFWTFYCSFQGPKLMEWLVGSLSVVSSAKGIRWFQGTTDSRESLIPQFLRGNSCGLGTSGSLESLMPGNHWFPKFGNATDECLDCVNPSLSIEFVFKHENIWNRVPKDL